MGEAATGRQALEMASDSMPNIAIVDFSLPEMNGLDLAHAIRRISPRTEILIFTMIDRDNVILEALRAGIRGFVLKSDPDRYLLAAVDALSVRRPYFSDTVSDMLLDQLAQSEETSILSRMPAAQGTKIWQLAIEQLGQRDELDQVISPRLCEGREV